MKKLPVKPLPKILHQHLSAPALLNQVRQDFEKMADPRRYGQQFSLTDVLMSGLAVFSLKFPVHRGLLWNLPCKAGFTPSRGLKFTLGDCQSIG